MKKIIIFGAGNYGSQAYERYGSERVAYFLDNDEIKNGTIFCGKPVINISQFLTISSEYHVVIASLYWRDMKQQLLSYGFTDFSLFLQEYRRFYETDDLIYNPYQVTEQAMTEEEWTASNKIDYARKSVYEAVEELYENTPLFNHIEIETINRCNGVCSFCPVNCKIDPREKKIMSEEVFYHIVDQLEDLHYSGRFTTFSNNEPLLDERIIAFNQYARKHLPDAKMHLFTNGTLLTIDKFKSLIQVLDELIIDNYNQELNLIKPCLEIKEYCEQHPEVSKKVTIVLRKPYEILTSRGGTAPNRQKLAQYNKDRCVLPYKQMIIRPDGKVSLCCNDAIGKFTLGDVTKEKLDDIWFGNRMKMVRKCLYEGRENWGNCQYCDTFSMG